MIHLDGLSADIDHLRHKVRERAPWFRTIGLMRGVKTAPDHSLSIYEVALLGGRYDLIIFVGVLDLLCRPLLALNGAFRSRSTAVPNDALRIA